MKKKMIYLLIPVLLIVGSLVYVVKGKAGVGNTYQKQYELGQKYLDELKYEEAVEAFTAAIEIDDKKPEAYVGRADAYTVLGYWEDAIADYEAAQQRQTTEVRVEKRIRVIKRGYDLLKELQEYCVTENYDAIFTNLANEEYKEIVADLLGEEIAARLIDKETKLMTAMFETTTLTDGFEESVYMVYHGEQEERLRVGDGIWLGYNEGNNYFARGTWVDDKPNGEFETRSWQAVLDEEVTYRVISGNAVDGLWDGMVLWGFERPEGIFESWTPSFTAGKWTVLREETLDDGTVAYIVDETGALTVTDPDKEEGIAGFANNA